MKNKNEGTEKQDPVLCLIFVEADTCLQPKVDLHVNLQQNMENFKFSLLIVR